MMAPAKIEQTRVDAAGAAEAMGKTDGGNVQDIVKQMTGGGA